MKTQTKQTSPENKKHSYAKPEIKKREQLKEVTEQNPIPITLLFSETT